MERRSIGDYLIMALIAIIASVGIVIFARPIVPGSGGSEQHVPVSSQSVYERVLKSSTIRCGYVTYPPGCIKDPNTGKLSGIFVETLERAAANMELKVDWVEEVGWGSMIEGLRADRYDLIGSPVWANSTRGKLVDFTVPLFYSGIGVYVRANDNRFTSDLSGLNSSEVRLATIDGEMSDIIAKQQFQKANRVSLPQLSDNSQLLLNIVDGKADATFVEPYIAQLFLKNNPNSLQNVVRQKPIRIFPNTMMMKKGELQLKTMLDTAISELINSGYLDELLRKYSPEPGAFYPVAYPYRLEGQ